MKTNKILWLFLNIFSDPKNAQYYNILSHIINYQHFSIVFGTIIRLGLHEHYEHYKMPNSINGTTQCYERCLILSIYWLPRD
jgi:hypothetical protein